MFCFADRLKIIAFSISETILELEDRRNVQAKISPAALPASKNDDISCNPESRPTLLLSWRVSDIQNTK